MKKISVFISRAGSILLLVIAMTATGWGQAAKTEVLTNDDVIAMQQAGLSPTWQWVLYTYGPSLLEALGTFRFLLTDLVPLQLILESRLEASSMEGPA